jgi:hypothetical protein
MKLVYNQDLGLLIGMKVPNPRMCDPDEAHPKIERRFKCLEVV